MQTETAVGVYRTGNLKMKATFSSKQNFSSLRQYNRDVTGVEQYLVSAVCGQHNKGQAGQLKIGPICCTE